MLVTLDLLVGATSCASVKILEYTGSRMVRLKRVMTWRRMEKIWIAAHDAGYIL